MGNFFDFININDIISGVIGVWENNIISIFINDELIKVGIIFEVMIFIINF